jgi:hypothetical protein
VAVSLPEDFPQLSEMLCKEFDCVVRVQKILGAVLVARFVMNQDLLRENARWHLRSGLSSPVRRWLRKKFDPGHKSPERILTQELRKLLSGTKD